MKRFAAALAAALAAASPAAAQEAVVRDFLAAHCAGCHGEEVRERELRLDGLAYDLARPESFAVWLKVHDKIESGEMPPPKKARPEAGKTSAVLRALAKDLKKADLARRQAEGRAVGRRLNRVEYEHTLRDLLALPRLAVKDLLPEDGRAHGFSKSGGALDLSHAQLAKYLEAADVALDAAIATYPEKPELFKRRYLPGDQYDFKITLLQGDSLFLKDFKYDERAIPVIRDKWLLNELGAREKSGFFPYEGTVGCLRSSDDGFQGRFDRFAAVYPGFYRVRLSTWSFLWDKGQVKPSPVPQASNLLVGSRLLGYFDAPSLEPKVHELVAWLDPGDKIKWNPASLAWIRVSERPGKAAEYVGPGVALDWIEIEGPLVESWPPESHRRLFGDLPIARLPEKSEVRPPRREPLPHAAPFPPKPKLDRPSGWSVASADPVGDARRLLGAFLKRAFRRPAPSSEVERYLDIVRERLRAQVTFEEAMRTAYKAVLCSPDVLFLREAPGALDAHALASRLSYFLWSSMPDDALLALADSGKLRDPAVLRAQTERLLHDPKAERFVEDFSDQWLALRDIDATTPDTKLYPEFDLYLRDSMLQETRAFLRELIEKDLGVANLADSDWAMLNQRLAELYEIPDVLGSAVRRVSLPAGSLRGGLLTQGSVLKVSANGTTTSPVTRGAWVLDKILNRPPEPPPPDLPAIDPDVRGTTTIREQLDKHRSSPACAACHVRIDPPGFALESYDVIGGWRTRYRSIGEGTPVGRPGPAGRPLGYKLGKEVDPSGTLPDGRAFKDIHEYKAHLRKDPDALAWGLAEKLLVYATGAAPRFSDREGLEKAVAAARAKGHGVRSLLHAVVQGEAFRSK